MYDDLDDIIVLEEGKVGDFINDNVFFGKEDKMTDAQIRKSVENGSFIDEIYWKKKSIDKLKKERDKHQKNLDIVEKAIEKYDNNSLPVKILKQVVSVFSTPGWRLIKAGYNLEGRISLQQTRYMYRRSVAFLDKLIEEKEAEEKKAVKESFDLFDCNL